MKKKVTTIVVLLVTFLIALGVFSIILNRGTDDMKADMGSAKLPTISFEESGYQVNPLEGYVQEMDITKMRNQILPVSVGTSVTADISGYAGKIHSFQYEILDQAGEKILKSETLHEITDTVKIELGDTISDGEEKVLRITLVTEEEEQIYYYMRLIRAAEFNVQQCLEFAEHFHQSALEEGSLTEFVNSYSKEGAREPKGLQTVTLASDIQTLAWRDFKPEIVGDVVWEIKESNHTYTSLCLKYCVKSAAEEKSSKIYHVSEFFKVRCLKGRASLEVYERTMNEFFDGKAEHFDKKGILLGLTEENVDYLTSDDGNQVSFVQEREVWHYNKKKNQISLLFSFSDAENEDIRNYRDQHTVRLLDMDREGNTVFAVYGYMNRGSHEGQTGAAIYYYDLKDNYVQEKAFISSRNSGEVVQKRLSQLTFYNKKSNHLYAMFEGVLYKIDLKSQKKEVIKDQLSENQYASSHNGRYVVYQKDGSLHSSNQIEVWDLEKETSFVVKVPEEEMICPIGFVKGDVVYGVGKEMDAGKNAAGEDVVPFYKLEIRNGKNEIVKVYENPGIYISDADVVENMITIDQVIYENGIYSAVAQDSITNNEGKKEKDLVVEKIPAELKGFQIRLTDEEGLMDTEPNILKPKQMLEERATMIDFETTNQERTYYVYGLGKLQGIYDQAGEAICEADKIRGVVTTSKQKKIWERGNRLLSYQIKEVNAKKMEEGKTSLIASLEMMLEHEAKRVDVAKEFSNGKSMLDILNAHIAGEALDLTGCNPEQLCYLIGKGTPVLAMTGMNQAILLTGYDNDVFTYINPETGEKKIADEDVIKEKVVESQGTFIGYVK